MATVPASPPGTCHPAYNGGLGDCDSLHPDAPASLADLEETRRRNLPDGFYVADKALKRADGWLQIARAGTGFLVLSRRLLLAMVRQYPELTIQHPTYG